MADTASFHYIQNYYAADNRHLYYKQNMISATDSRSLQAIIYDAKHSNLPDEYIRDDAHVYFLGRLIKGAQPAAFTSVEVADDTWNTRYAFDGKHYFNEEYEILVDGDEQKTQLKLLTLDKAFTWSGIFYQGNAIYCYDTDRHQLILMGNRDNTAAFTQIDRGIFTDGKHVYFSFNRWNRSGGRMPRFIGHTSGLCIVKGADPRNFVPAGSFFTADHMEGTLYRSGNNSFFHPGKEGTSNYSPGLMLLKSDGTTKQLPIDDGFSKFINDKDDGYSIFSLKFYKNLFKADSVYDDY